MSLTCDVTILIATACSGLKSSISVRFVLLRSKFVSFKTMGDIKLGDVVALQGPVEGEQQPVGKEDGLAPESSQLAQDSADMCRLGRSQQLTV